MLDFFGANFDYNVLESRSRKGLHSLTPSSVIQHVLRPSHCPSAPASLSRVSPGAFLGPPTQCTRMFQGDVVVTPPPHGFLSLHSGFLVSHEAVVVREAPECNQAGKEGLPLPLESQWEQGQDPEERGLE